MISIYLYSQCCDFSHKGTLPIWSSRLDHAIYVIFNKLVLNADVDSFCGLMCFWLLIVTDVFLFLKVASRYREPGEADFLHVFARLSDVESIDVLTDNTKITSSRGAQQQRLPVSLLPSTKNSSDIVGYIVLN